MTGSVGITICELPFYFIDTAEQFVDLVMEGGHKGILSEADFRTAITKRFPGTVIDSPLLQPDVTDRTFDRNPCRDFLNLKRILGLDVGLRICDYARDADAVMDQLRAMMTRRWSYLDRFAALEFAGRALFTFYTRHRTTAATQLRGTSPVEPEFSPDHDEGLRTTGEAEEMTGYARQCREQNRLQIREEGGLITISGYIFNPKKGSQQFEIFFSTSQLETGSRIIDGFEIKVEGQLIPKYKYADILPDILEKTGVWSYRRCSWNILDRGLILFEFDKSSLSASARTYLTLLSHILKEEDAIHLDIIGHTDSSGDDVYNKRLAADRAKSVNEFFIRNGISKDRLNIISMGESVPIDAQEDETKNPFNRNVQLKIYTINPDTGERSGDICYHQASGLMYGECETPAACRYQTQEANGVYK